MQSGRRVLAASVLATVVLGGAATAAAASPRPSASAVSLLTARSEPATASATDSIAMASTSDSTGNQFLFWEGQNGALWYAVYTAAESSWSTSPASPGYSPMGSQPSAVTVDVGVTEYVYVFWQGTDGNLWYAYGVVSQGSASTATSIGSWSGPNALVGLAPLSSSPAVTNVVSGGQAGIDVFWEGSNGNLWSAIISGAGGTLSLQSGPTSIGDGPLGSAPTAGSDSSGNVYVYWQGSGNNTHVWEAWYDESTATWSGPIDLGAWTGNTGSPPSVVVDSSGDQYIFWQGQNGALWYADWNGSYWSGAIGVGYSPMGSAPAATETLAGSPASTSGFTVVWEGANLNMWYATYDFSTSTWLSSPGSEIYGPM
ncbi:MAG TPA: hypothetical protein VMD59_08795 [Acidimicrobiales bacterium]|nr:hypothetical protein [Acidimicrobiales bacterium]